ncbi:MAG: delta-60 repeat domain-containing protein, partial [Actinomycetota bacterium]|nr:delta-60 repeat domain-containing protein [Actinomycetota bacterium]
MVYRTHSTNDWKNTASDFGDGADDSFSGDGKFVASFGTADEYCRAGAIDADGKIVIAGYYKNSGSDWDTIIGRINTDGTWDTSFAGDGKYRLSFDQDDIFQDIAIQPDGKIVAVGTSDYGHTQGDILVARFTTAGA